MDFFGILFDIKNGKKVPYSKTYFDTLFAAKLAEMQIKTLTGTLPLTFTTSEEQLRDWTIYGNNYEHTYSAEGTLALTFTSHTAGNADYWSISGNNNVGKNLLKITRDSTTVNGVTLTVDKENGTVTANGKATATVSFGLEIDVSTYYGDFYASINTAGGSSNTFYAYLFDSTTSAYCTKWDGETLSKNIFANTSEEVKVISGHRTRLFLQIVNGYQCDNVIFKPMLRLPDTTADFEPYQIGVGQRTKNLGNNGYEIPLTINNTPQTFYIGDTPLTAGQSISKTSTGVDIAAIAGSNTITTSLYNKPSMSIEGVDYVGVGEPVNDSWQIPLTVSDGTNTATVNVPIDAPLTEGQSVTDTLTISTFEGANTIDTTLENKPKMKITYKGG